MLNTIVNAKVLMNLVHKNLEKTSRSTGSFRYDSELLNGMHVNVNRLMANRAGLAFGDEAISIDYICDSGYNIPLAHVDSIELENIRNDVNKLNRKRNIIRAYKVILG